MRHSGKIDIRIPEDMLDDLEQERRRMSRAAGAEIKMSAVVRALVLEGMRLRRRRSAKPRAATKPLQQ